MVINGTKQQLTIVILKKKQTNNLDNCNYKNRQCDRDSSNGGRFTRLSQPN